MRGASARGGTQGDSFAGLVKVMDEEVLVVSRGKSAPCVGRGWGDAGRRC